MRPEDRTGDEHRRVEQARVSERLLSERPRDVLAAILGRGDKQQRLTGLLARLRRRRAA